MIISIRFQGHPLRFGGLRSWWKVHFKDFRCTIEECLRLQELVGTALGSAAAKRSVGSDTIEIARRKMPSGFG